MEKLKNSVRKTSFTEFYSDILKRYYDSTAYIYKPDGYTKRSKYIKKSFSDLNKDRLILKNFFKTQNIENKRIAISGRNSYIWAVSLAAILTTDNIAIPLDKELQIEELKSSLERSETDILFYDKKYEDIVLEATKDISNLSIYTFDSIQKLLNENNIDIKALEKNDIKEIKDPNEMKILLFTSGTTAMSKMVILTTDNVLTNMYDVGDKEKLYNTDTNIALLPFHHIFGLVGSLIMLHYGVRTAFPDGLRYVAQNLEEYEVSVFIGVPLLVESIYSKVVESAKKNKKWKLLKIMIRISNGLRKIGIDIRRKLFKSVINGLGGHMRFIISAAASLDVKVLKFFNNVGILTIQGYGLTETSPVVSAETDTKQKLGSVGILMENTDVTIDKIALVNYYIDNLGYSKNDPIINQIEKGKEGEILVKGRSVTKGYYKDPEKTKEAFTNDGWFRTGDIGYLDDEFLFITGRIKDMIVLPNGKKAFPEELEFLFNKLDGVIEPFIFGSDKNLGFGAGGETKIYVAIYYDKDFFKDKSEEEIHEYFSNETKNINKTLPRYKYIRGVILSEREFIKTTTKKIKRNIEKENIEKEYSL